MWTERLAYSVNCGRRAGSTPGGLPREVVNLGIAIVVPASKILEVINQPSVRRLDERRANQAAPLNHE